MNTLFKIRVFQPIVPEYRVALFDGLAAKYGDAVEVVASSRLPSGDVSVPLHRCRYDYAHRYCKVGPFVWQVGFSLAGLKGGGDVVVINGDIHQLSTLWIAFKARLRGIRIVWWGHHVSARAKARQVAIRLWMARHLSDVYLCYTDAGIRYLEARGFAKGRVFATGNTIDLDAVERETKCWTGERLAKFKTEKGLSGKRVLLFCGVLREKVRLDVLLRALEIVRREFADIHLVVIGGGEKLEAWQRLAGELGLSASVTWVGELRGQDKLAPWFLSSEIFAYPGRIGLSLIHAFSFGLPVVLNDNKENHGPEYVAFRPGENGIAFKENDDGNLAEKLIQALKDPNISELGACGKEFVFKNYSMERMVERYSEALETAVAQ